MDEKRFQELHEKYGGLFDGDCPPDRKAYIDECWRRKLAEHERKQADRREKTE